MPYAPVGTICNVQYANAMWSMRLTQGHWPQLDSFKVHPPDAIKLRKVDSMASLASLFSFRNGAYLQGNGEVLNQDDATAHGGSQSGDTAAGKQGTGKQGTPALPLPSHQTLGGTPKVYTAYSFFMCLITLNQAHQVRHTRQVRHTHEQTRPACP